MKLLVLTCCYKRYDLFRKFLEHLPKDVTLVCVGDDDENFDSWEESDPFKGAYLIHENKPLSKKWNHGLEWCKKYDFDYLIITGFFILFSSQISNSSKISSVKVMLDEL